jgi:hypothetical protein
MKTGDPMRRSIFLCLAFIFSSLPRLAMAQEHDPKPADAPVHYYHLVYTVQEVTENGKVTNSRTYTTNARTGPATVQIRAGNRVPVCNDTQQRCSDSTATNFSYSDFGVSIDTRRVEDIDGRLALNIAADISDAINAPDPASGQLTNVWGRAINALTNRMITRQNKWSTDVLIPIGKPTVIFSSDSLSNKGKLQVELTATRID